MGLEELYKYLRWRMDPEDKRAVERFHRIVEVFEKLKDSKLISGSRVLDICAGTGIAGVALAKVLNAKKLTVLDVRREDLDKVEKWMEVAGIDVEVEKIVGDAKKVGELVEEHDVAVLFGLTMPHFNAFDAVKLFAGVASILSENGVFILEETDRVYGIMYLVGYKDFLVETKGKDYTLISVHEGYDPVKGVFKRTYYKLPGFEKVSEEEHRLWDLASQLALGSIFFKDYKLISKSEHGVEGVSHLVYLRIPRKDVAETIYTAFLDKD
ncbi:class I SAM-dependent methyltransferase [Pyrococcus abyssi]|uniref:SAM-dependent methyltransferase n=1 Tax=Pyrococcus abyssi (strain GE5 / Orsay) TaxID=272844 RepID=Q9V214_PYRAB|nr:class I SAM-dependent methyltransferase [Pyrococcus abyssi]CAB49184.1 SAM-dependent methyltransferase [Pyrococcus abyssi GE5]CCE69637.1 TPA: SAM-dependent methyltransferase [Pyrococcus abyssi GE5]